MQYHNSAYMVCSPTCAVCARVREHYVRHHTARYVHALLDPRYRRAANVSVRSALRQVALLLAA